MHGPHPAAALDAGTPNCPAERLQCAEGRFAVCTVLRVAAPRVKGMALIGQGNTLPNLRLSGGNYGH